MPLTQEKHLNSNFTNNNDHSYLHKKFKKMATTTSVPPVSLSREDTKVNKEISVSVSTCKSTISNASISAAHPEIEKIKQRETHSSFDKNGENDVQINCKNENNRLSDANCIDHVSGQTSYTDEFLNKTENRENDFFREVPIGGTSGRYVCPYCKLSCAKPSVLQKHIRAHTNERPYPCIPCGFAFKTKSNLYKHRRSRTHALRLQGADVSIPVNEEDLSGGSESDTSLPPTSISDAGSDSSIVRVENSQSNDTYLPEPTNDSSILNDTNLSSNDIKIKTIYKPKFRAAFYQESNDKYKSKKTISSTADFLTEHISKIISDNEAIVDVIETPLQKKYGKIKQIAESKQFLNENEAKSDYSPLNLTKSNIENDNLFRKRSHSESFSQSDNNKHPLNPEGSIIKDLLLKTKMNGLAPVTTELVDGLGPLYICPLCQIIYRSADNLEIHRMYYCKGNLVNTTNEIALQKNFKETRPENAYVRSNSVNVRFPETQVNSLRISSPTKSPPLKSKPDNLILVKPECTDVVAPLPSPGPLLGNTRLVDTRSSSDLGRKTDCLKIKQSPKRKIETNSELFSPKSEDNITRNPDYYTPSKFRCVEMNSNGVAIRSLENISPHSKHSSPSLQMFGGEVKIVDHLGSTTTLRIEPSKNQLSPILIHQNLSPSKFINDAETSNIVVRSGLQSGGIIVHNPPTPKETKAQTLRIPKSTPTGTSNSNMPNIHERTRFQFPPPLSAITAFNPLTLPPLSPSASPSGATTILHGGKLIPHVPGIPGPNTPGILIGNSTTQSNNEFHSNSVEKNGGLVSPNANQGTTIVTNYEKMSREKSPNSKMSPLDYEKQNMSSERSHYISTLHPVNSKISHDGLVIKSFSPIFTKTENQDVNIKRNSDIQTKLPTLKEKLNNYATKNVEKLNFSNSTKNKVTKSETRSFNFENLITKTEIYNNQILSSSEVQKNTNANETPVELVQTDRSETSYFQKNTIPKSSVDERNQKFLRPTTLPLKPGTFTPKKHHGITPNANTMPLVSPETPRPAKAYGQLYLNGNAYTYLGLKCSTKVFYCTINRPQPTYVPNQHFLSMYSNWQLLSELTPDPLGLSASCAMSLYDSRHRPQNVVVAEYKQDLILTHSSQWNTISKDTKQTVKACNSRNADQIKPQLGDTTETPKRELAGGFESNEEYTYVRGRGRGRYVCSECGIRCKKPSMLKKHIRTHTDVRPYTCIHCAFSFKTKGNLTKHMKSKAHYKKCCELGLNPNEGQDAENFENAQCSGETDDDTDSEGDEGNEGETESSDTEVSKSRLPEHEAAHCLLSLGSTRPTTSATPGLITSARPTTYPYTPAGLENPTVCSGNDQLHMSKNNSAESKVIDNEPMDLSKNEVKMPANMPEIPTARESSVLASLASNTAKLPQHPSHWSNGEPLLHTYLTERALLDTKIKQSQLTSSLKLQKLDLEKHISKENGNFVNNMKSVLSMHKSTVVQTNVPSTTNDHVFLTKSPLISNSEKCTAVSESPNNLQPEPKRIRTSSNPNAENAKYVVSEYLKHARINMKTVVNKDAPTEIAETIEINSNLEEHSNTDELINHESESLKLTSLDHDPIARKVVIGAGGVAFKVTKGKEFENAGTYSPGRLMEDGRRVCDFCNKTFTKPSQLRLHLNIHYMERPFRCSACAVSFRTRGHLQKHERSGSHHNKVSMTSTFGAATSLNPRPFRCSDCNIAFRIHGHLAKHLRSKMHVMRLECLFKLPFGTFTEIERAGVSLTDIDTTDCASSLASLQSLARKLHENDPTRLEYRTPNNTATDCVPANKESNEEEDTLLTPEKRVSNNVNENKCVDNSEYPDKET